MVGGVPIVLGLLGHREVASGYQSAVHDQHSVFPETSAGLESEMRLSVGAGTGPKHVCSAAPEVSRPGCRQRAGQRECRVA
jgi:hypothetical protein